MLAPKESGYIRTLAASRHEEARVAAVGRKARQLHTISALLPVGNGLTYHLRLGGGGSMYELFIIPIAVACVSRTFIFEEIFREFREYCVYRSERAKGVLERKCYYLFTCEYCFSHYVTIVFLFITRYKLIYPDWRGYLMAFFCIVFIANVYMNLYSRVRVGLTSEKKEIELKEQALAQNENGSTGPQSKQQE